MAVLSRDDFFNRINSVIGTDTSEDSIAFIEDMTDTFNNMENLAHNNGEDWERRYHELDESWKAKYKQRFFNGGGRSSIPTTYHEDNEPDNQYDPDKVTFDSLFE